MSNLWNKSNATKKWWWKKYLPKTYFYEFTIHKRKLLTLHYANKFLWHKCNPSYSVFRWIFGTFSTSVSDLNHFWYKHSNTYSSGLIFVYCGYHFKVYHHYSREKNDNLTYCSLTLLFKRYTSMQVLALMKLI